MNLQEYAAADVLELPHQEHEDCCRQDMNETECILAHVKLLFRKEPDVDLNVPVLDKASDHTPLAV